jgi:putative ABC transport system permease protein
MTACSALPFSGRLQEFNFPVRAEGMPEGRKWYALTVLADHDFVGTMGLKVVDGRDLSRQFGTDAAEGFVLNETAVRELGWEWPVGRRLEMDGVADGRAKAGRVVGVVADFHYDTIHHKIGPVVIQVAPAAYYLDYLAFRVDAAHAARALAFLKSAWAEAAPGRPFEYRFLDESFGQLYRKEERMARFFGGFSVLAIVIGCLGILGLAALSAEKRTKEVGIRKVLGSSTADIAARLTGDQLKGVVLANLIAWPAAYFLMTRWLANFAYRVKLGPWPFLAAAGLTLVVTLIAAGVQGLKAALANPVEALKYE